MSGRGHLPVLFLLLAISFAASPASAITFEVDRTDDTAAATGCDPVVPSDCSLRGAIIAANALPGPTTIDLAAGTYTLSEATSCAHATNQFGVVGLTAPTLCVQKPMTIVGAGAAATIIDAGNTGPVFVVGNVAPVEIRDLTMREGLFAGGSLWGHGGAINNAGELTIANAVLSDNTSGASGGAIYNANVLTVRNSRFERNSATQEGGAIFNASFNVRTSVTIVDSTLADNVAANGGGAVANYGGDVFVTGSNLQANVAGNYAGAVWNITGAGLLVMINSTLSGNESHFSYGGAIWNGAGTARLHSVTIADNHAGVGSTNGIGGGIANGPGATLEIGNSIVAGNTGTYAFGASVVPDCYDGGTTSTVTSLGHNLIGVVNDECSLAGNPTGNLVNVAAGLGVLADNGGPTLTHGLLATSPAIDAGDPAGCVDDDGVELATDQRGQPRTIDGDGDGSARCDIGALERSQGLRVERVTPARIGSTGSVLLLVAGNGFLEGATVLLRRAGETDLWADGVAVDEAGGALAASLTLDGEVEGAWDVVVTNPDTEATTLPLAVTVETPRAPDLWIDVVGPVAIRLYSPARFLIAYGNRGNVDAYDVPIAVSVPLGFGFEIGPVTPPPTQAGQVALDWSGVPLNMVEQTTPDRRIVPLVLPVVPAGATGLLPFFLTGTEPHGATFEIGSKIGTPYFAGAALDPDVPVAMMEAARALLEDLGLDASGVADPPLLSYATSGLETIQAEGNAAARESLGGEARPYALHHLLVDVASYAASLAGAEPLAAMRTAAAPAAGGGGGGFPPNPPPADCTILANQGGVLLEGQSFGSPGGGPPPSCRFPPDGPRYPGGAVDPNAKYGSIGAGDAHYVRPDEPLRYAITFENLATATLPAAQVTITDVLDPTKVDLATFTLGPVAFGDVTVSVPAGLAAYTHDVDLRPAQDLLVRVEAGLDVGTAVATWKLTALDPATMEPPSDPTLGFLPPNTDPPAGDGMVAYTILPLATLVTDTVIPNAARIVFDNNAPIDTDVWSNAIDGTPPATQVTSAVPGLCSVELAWSGTDTGSGIESRTILASEDGGPLVPLIENTTDGGAVVPGRLGATYGFASVGRDRVGNVETTPAEAQAIATVTDCGPFDLAVTKLAAPKRVKLSAKKPTLTKLLRVVIQNRSARPITIPDVAALANLVTLELSSAGGCDAPVAVLRQGRPQKDLPLTLESKASLRVAFDVTFDCANDPSKGAGHEDFVVTAAVRQSALVDDDAHPEDDTCPRAPTGIDPYPNDRLQDKGCGPKSGVLQIDVVVK